jgi:hypothetical protein
VLSLDVREFLEMNIVQIGSLERDLIAGAIRDIEDVVQQMAVEPRLAGFGERISRAARRLEWLAKPATEFGERVTDLDALIPINDPQRSA